ncbi:longevity assurance proteins LAG1/LAC1 [Mycena sanguinolenta]|nr:longevity assurance proteins LAG1/LAC1 [Mycena sanguinolenta]
MSSASALRVLALPPILAVLSHFLLPSTPNPFTPFFLLSHRAPFPAARPNASTSPDPSVAVYVKGPLDLLFIGYAVVLFSFLRLVLSHAAFPALARRWGITKRGKVERFGEQGYQAVYFASFGAWGYNLLTSRTLWFTTRHFWLDYPHTHLPAALKAYYLLQIAYWLQQALVLGLGLEKRRSDHWELVVHHVVTVWMVTWSYMMNVTLLGNAVFVSMDVPDVLLAFSKMLNYLRLERAKVVSFVVFVIGWGYFRHYISIRILWSLRAEFWMVPEPAQVFRPLEGLYMALWIRDQMFFALCVLQGLNLFWGWLILRILYRTIMVAETDDDRSEDEDEAVHVEVVGQETKEKGRLGEERLGEQNEKTVLVVRRPFASNLPPVCSLTTFGSQDHAQTWTQRGKSEKNENRKERGVGGGLSLVGNGNGDASRPLGEEGEGRRG